jgi:FtsP/CotA-like multicopper oxidase with cupredoxin domain
MDGVSRITQCPIGPGDSLVYKFNAAEMGTHWYHAHSGDQRMDGLYGPFIVTNKYANGEIVDRKEVPQQEYDKEFYMLIQDWFQSDAESIINRIIWEDGKFIYGDDNLQTCLNATATDDGTPGVFLPIIRNTDAILVNGKVKIE